MHLSKPLLSVLVPAHNVGGYIHDCVKSLLRQTYHPLEILICDDASSDDTWQIVSKFSDSRVKLFRNTTNEGKNQTCSFLLERAGGDYVTVHDGDDISVPTRLEKQMDFFMQNPEYVMCGTNFIGFLDNKRIIQRSDLAISYEEITANISTQSQFHGPTVVFKKKILSEVGGFYRYFTRAEDIDLTMRIAERFKVANLPEHLYFYRHQPLSLTNNINGYSAERLAHFQLLYYLARERSENNGIDSLMKGDTQKVEGLIHAFMREFEGDPDIPLRRGVFRLLCMGMYKNAILLSWSVMRRNASMLNVKCFFYAALQSARGRFQLMTRDKINLDFLH